MKQVPITTIEARVITDLIELALTLHHALDDSEELQDGTHLVENDGFQALCKALDVLEALPDDQPGYTMGPAAKARWALRRILGSDDPETAARSPLRHGHHIDAEGRFRSDRHPELPPDKIVLSFQDPHAQRALAVLAADYREADAELAGDIEHRLWMLDLIRREGP